MHDLTLRTGFEIELLAPPGSDRKVLADELAARCHGSVRTGTHKDSEPSTVPGVGIFRHLSPAFDVVDADDRPVARLVDDVTIETELVGSPRSSRTWYRLLCDDPRLLRLVDRHTDPDAPLDRVLEPVAELFGTRVELRGVAARVNDASGTTVAVALPLPLGRERPCEIVTPPLSVDHGPALERLLGPARDLGFTVPVEAAVHVHVDGAPFRTPEAFTNLVRLFSGWRELLWAALGTNPACRRLAPLTDELVEIVGRLWQDDSDRTGWSRLQEAARSAGVTKFADVNLSQLVSERPVRDTVEVRILPGSIHVAEILDRARLVDALLRRCLAPRPVPLAPPAGTADPNAVLWALAEESR